MYSELFMVNPILLDQSILMFTDGACKGNPGPGGWGTILAFPNGQIKELGAAHKDVTNNQMELRAVIEGLRAIKKESGDLAILTDSTYVIQGMTQWIWGWRRNGWKTASGQDVSNQALWQALSQECASRKELGQITWHYVRGHQGIEGNERADEIASELALGHKVALYDGSLLAYTVDIHAIPEDTSLPTRSKSSKKSSKAKAYSYLSYVNGQFQRHSTWKECEAQVKGRSGAKFKKAMSAQDEEEIKREWGIL